MVVIALLPVTWLPFISVYGAGGDDTIRLGNVLTGSALLLDGGNNADTITIGGIDSNNASIYGGAGADTIVGGSVSATSTAYFDAGAGQDRLSGGLFNGTILGGAGNDTLKVVNLSASTLIDGGNHDDTISVTTSFASASTINGGEGADSITMLVLQVLSKVAKLTAVLVQIALPSTPLLTVLLVLRSPLVSPSMVVLVRIPSTSVPTCSLLLSQQVTSLLARLVLLTPSSTMALAT